jgi:hypothetical protein
MGAMPVPGPTQITGMLTSGGNFISPLSIPIRKESPEIVHLSWIGDTFRIFDAYQGAEQPDTLYRRLDGEL